MPDAIAITGFGAVCSAGIGAEPLHRLLHPGGRAFHPTTRFGDPPSPAITFGIVPGHDQPMGDLPDGVPQRLCIDFAVHAAREALGDARSDPARIGLFVGSNLEDYPDSLAALTAAIARAVGIRGPCSTVSVACASSLLAIDVATTLLRRGDIDIALAGGSDVLTPRVVAGFRLLGLLSEEPCTPFGDVLGTSLGEGAAFVRLERSSADAIAYIVGYGQSCDAYHLTRPDPSGRGVARAVRAAFAQFGIAPADVDYVGAHATGTAANDLAEVRGLAAAFAGRLPPLTATKSLIGHAQGASGALELAVTLAGAQAQRIPPSVLRSRRRGIDVSIAEPGDPPRDHRVALRCSSGFGGANCALLVGRSPVSAPGGASSSAIVRADAVCGSAVGAEVLREALQRGDRLDTPPTLDLQRLARHHDAARYDPSTAWLTTVVARCTDDLSDADLERTALVVVQSWSSSQTMHRLSDRIRELGLGRMSAQAFARSLNVAPAGTCAELLGIRGGLEVFNGGAAAGVFALARAAALLDEQADLARVLAVAVHEPRTIGDGAVGAVCVRVEREGPTRLAGIATAGPHDAGSAVTRACEAAGHRLERGDALYIVGDGAELEPLPGGAKAVRIAARGPVAGLGACVGGSSPGRTLVVGTSPGALSCALLLDRHG